MQRGLNGGASRPPVSWPASGRRAGARRSGPGSGGAWAAAAVALAIVLAAGGARAADALPPAPDAPPPASDAPPPAPDAPPPAPDAPPPAADAPPPAAGAAARARDTHRRRIATPPGVRDPFEHFNRGTYAFNDAIDRAFAKPVARAYKAVVPRPVREVISNFLANLDYPTVLVNDVLQGKLRAAGQDVARLAINTTIGIGGLFDPATHWGLVANDEDFGQTLGVWGVGPGPYVVLPFLGPSDMRDAPARFVDRYTNIAHYAKPTSIQYYVMAVDLLDRRTSLLAADAAVEEAFDPYTFVRNSYLQRREYRVRDGNMPEEIFDDVLPEPAAEGAPAAPASAAPAATPDAPAGTGPRAAPGDSTAPPADTATGAAPTAATGRLPGAEPVAATAAAAAPDLSAEPPPPSASPPPR